MDKERNFKKMHFKFGKSQELGGEMLARTLDILARTPENGILAKKPIQNKKKLVLSVVEF